MKIQIRPVWRTDTTSIINRHPVLKDMPNVVEEKDELFFLGESLEQLIGFARTLQEEVIVLEDDGKWWLEIYDTYRE